MPSKMYLGSDPEAEVQTEGAPWRKAIEYIGIGPKRTGLCFEHIVEDVIY